MTRARRLPAGPPAEAASAPPPPCIPTPLHPALLDEVRRYAGHALLLSGPARMGKRELALNIAALQNCSQPDAPCGACSSCRAMRAGTHPDLLIVEPSATTAKGKVSRKQLIPVTAIVKARDEDNDYEEHVYEFLEVRSTYRRRVVVIDGAEFLHEKAANALLKLVEEPPHGALFVFLTEDEGLVIPTIVSRCARLAVRPLPDAELRRLEALAGREVGVGVLMLAQGRPGVLLEVEVVVAALESARTLTAAVRKGMLPALEAAGELEKRFDPEWHPQTLRFVWRDEALSVRARADLALERTLTALESYANPGLTFQLLALELRAAFGEG
ncbi:MAG: DNA polymerase III [Deinococcus sp.]